MPFSVTLIRQLEKVEPKLRDVLLSLLEEVERQREESVTKKEFLEFARKTEENFQRVWKSIQELTEAQKRTEARVEELAEAQKKTEARVEELAEAQKKTEDRLTRLEGIVEELAEAQKKTEEELKALVVDHKKTREMVAGLSDTVGYGLEDDIFPYMEDFVSKEYQIEPEVLDRRSVVYPDGRYDEINIYIEGSKDGDQYLVIGECKSKPGKRDVKRFSQILERLRRYSGKKVEGFMVGYYYSPQVLSYISDEHPDIKTIKGFEFRLKYKVHEIR